LFSLPAAKACKLRAHYRTVRERLVKLFAQHGFSDGLKTVEGLRKELIDGVIFSPRDITPEKLRECASKFTESAPISERLFDPLRATVRKSGKFAGLRIGW